MTRKCSVAWPFPLHIAIISLFHSARNKTCTATVPLCAMKRKDMLFWLAASRRKRPALTADLIWKYVLFLSSQSVPSSPWISVPSPKGCSAYAFDVLRRLPAASRSPQGAYWYPSRLSPLYSRSPPSYRCISPSLTHFFASHVRQTQWKNF